MDDTALMTQLPTPAVTPLLRLETMIDMTDDPLLMTDMGATLLLLLGQGHLLEGVPHRVGKSLRDLLGLFNLVYIPIHIDRSRLGITLLRLNTVAQ